MDIRAQIVKVGVAVVMLGLGQSAMAVCMNSDVTFRGSAADDCADNIGTGPGGNILSTALDTAFPNTGTNTGTFEGLVKDNAGGTGTVGATAFGIDWTLSANAANAGTFILGWTASSPNALPVALDIVFGLKASNSASAYLFTAEEFFVSPNTGSGTFSITFLNNGGQFPALSNITAWGRNPNYDCCREDELPEPGSLALLGLGLLGLGLSRRRVRLTN